MLWHPGQLLCQPKAHPGPEAFWSTHKSLTPHNLKLPFALFFNIVSMLEAHLLKIILTFGLLNYSTLLITTSSCFLHLFLSVTTCDPLAPSFFSAHLSDRHSI